MFYMKHIKQKSFLRTSPICFLLFINKILILIFYFYWKHFMPSIPSKGISLAQKVKNLLLNVGDIGSVPGSRSKHCIGSSDQNHPQEKEMQKRQSGCLRRSYTES